MKNVTWWPRFFVFALLGIVLAPTASVTQAKRDQGEPYSETRKIRVKIVFDQFFAENAKNVIGSLVQKQPALWSAKNPEDLAIEIIEKLSQRYQDIFDITFIPVRPMTNIVLPTGILGDKAFIWALWQCSCDGAELMIGLTGAFVMPAEDKAENNNGLSRPEFVYTSGGSHESSGRIFASLHIKESTGEEILAKTLDSLDHEVRHMFGVTHPLDVMAGSIEERLFFFKSVATVRKNRAKQFNCEKVFQNSH